MDFTLVIHCDNAAFDDDPHGEVARILRQTADRINADGFDISRTLRDLSGNTVGSWGVTA